MFATGFEISGCIFVVCATENKQRPKLVDNVEILPCCKVKSQNIILNYNDIKLNRFLNAYQIKINASNT